jgi:anti-sigma factor RsiW
MSDLQPQSETSGADELLVAYLDGELAADEQVRVERRLADDPEFRARLAQLQRAWDLLDALERTEADEDFARSTVEMVAVKAASDVEAHRSKSRLRQAWLYAIGGSAMTVSLVAGYLLVARWADRPNRELVRDLPVIERVDEYRNAESVDFLRELHKEGLFAQEVNDAL